MATAQPQPHDQQSAPIDIDHELLQPCLTLAYHALSCASHINHLEIKEASFQELMQKCMNLLIPYIEPAYAASESNLCKLRSRIQARDDQSSVFVNDEASSEDGITSRVHYLLISACIIWYLVRHNMH